MKKQGLLILGITLILLGGLAHAKSGDVIWQYEQFGRIDSGIYITSVSSKDVISNDCESQIVERHKKEHTYKGKGKGHKKYDTVECEVVVEKTNKEAILILVTSLQEFGKRESAIIGLNPLTGEVIYETVILESEYIQDIVSVGDTTGDGFEDVIIGSVSSEEDIYFMIGLDGKTGEILYSIVQDTEFDDTDYYYFSPVKGDYNGNGKEDNVVIKTVNGDRGGDIPIGLSIIKALQ